MKTNFLFLFFILFQTACNSQPEQADSLLKGSWIAVRDQAKTNGVFIPVTRGALINFTEKEVTFATVKSNDQSSRTYYLREDSIVVDTQVLGTIIHLSEDSLVIKDKSQEYEVTFLPLRPTDLLIRDTIAFAELVYSSPWKLNVGPVKYTLYFDSLILKEHVMSTKQAGSVVYEWKTPDFMELSDFEWWKIKYFADETILVFSNGQVDMSIFHIQEYSPNVIRGNYIDWSDKEWVVDSMIAVNTLKPSQLDSLKKLVSGYWKMVQLINPSLQELTTETDDFPGGFDVR